MNWIFEILRDSDLQSFGHQNDIFQRVTFGISENPKWLHCSVGINPASLNFRFLSDSVPQAKCIATVTAPKKSAEYIQIRNNRLLENNWLAIRKRVYRCAVVISTKCWRIVTIFRLSIIDYWTIHVTRHGVTITSYIYRFHPLFAFVYQLCDESTNNSMDLGEYETVSIDSIDWKLYFFRRFSQCTCTQVVPTPVARLAAQAQVEDGGHYTIKTLIRPALRTCNAVNSAWRIERTPRSCASKQMPFSIFPNIFR